MTGQDPYVIEINDVTRNVMLTNHRRNTKNVHEYYVEFRLTADPINTGWQLVDESDVGTDGTMPHTYSSAHGADAAIRRHATKYVRENAPNHQRHLPAILEVNYQVVRIHMMVEPQSARRVILREHPAFKPESDGTDEPEIQA